MAKHSSDVYHVTPFKTYVTIFVSLLILTVVTVWAAEWDVGAWHTIIAFVIATAKALLVMTYFMHLKYDNNINRLVMASGFFFLFLLYVLCAIDEATREQVMGIVN